MDPAQFSSSCEEDSSNSLSFDTGSSAPHDPLTINAESTDDGPLTSAAAGYLSPDGASGVSAGGALLVPTSRSISVTSFEGDPPDVEDDRDFYETEGFGGEILCLCCTCRPNTHTMYMYGINYTP